jgi:hypothetical protein
MKISKPLIITVGIVILLFGLVIQVLYDPVSSARHALMVSNVRAELPQARAKWDAAGITDYTFEIQGDARSICQPSAIIEVRNNIVVKVETKDFTSADSPAQILPPDRWADPDWGEEVFLCSYFHFTMPQVFDLVEQTLQSYPSSIMQAEFDPEYGFVSGFRFGIYVGYGLLKPRLSDCCNDLVIKNFQPLTDSPPPP